MRVFGAQNGDRWQAAVNTVMLLDYPSNEMFKKGVALCS
jgi:hypothetical protein